MKQIFWFVFLVALAFRTLAGQETIVKGRVIDKNTRQPVIAANLVLPDGTGTYSIDEGRFTLKIAAFPIVLKISHISYVTQVISLDYAPGTDLLIEMTELVSEIGEVEISTRRLRILTKNDDFSLQDFVFDNENLWLLGYTNNQGSKGKLFLASWYGDTISSISVPQSESLYRDVFGTAYLVLKDSAYQLFGKNGRIALPYAMERNEFSAMMDPILAGFTGKLVYSDIHPWEQRAEIYYRDAYLPGRQLLAIVEDQIGRLNNLLTWRVGSIWTDLAVNYPVKNGTKVSDMIENPVRVPVFSWKDTLFIVNMYKDSLLSYTPFGRFKRSVPFSYCKDVAPGVISGAVRYRKITFLADPVGSGLFLLEHRGSHWTLLPVNTGTGVIGQPVMLPEYPDMYRITVYGNAVYFLYPEKTYPYYVRLFRYQM